MDDHVMTHLVDRSYRRVTGTYISPPGLGSCFSHYYEPTNDSFPAIEMVNDQIFALSPLLTQLVLILHPS